jgi:hypothetical protein
MRGVLIVVLSLAAAALLTGMGGLGGVPGGTVPKTDENIRARLVDRSGVTVELTQFSMDGDVFLEGSRGDGTMTVFFKEIAEIRFGAVAGEEVPAELMLKAGGRLQLEVRKRAVFYGSTGVGAYRVVARDVARIEFP